MEKKFWILLAAVVVFGIVFNFLILSNPPQKNARVACIGDICVVGQNDPIPEANALIQSSSDVILVVEADKRGVISQRSQAMSEALVGLAGFFGDKKHHIYGIEIEGGKPVGCLSQPLDFCLGLKPNATSMLVQLKYPNYQKNEIVVSERTIYVQPRSGEDAKRMVALFAQLFVEKSAVVEK